MRHSLNPTVTGVDNRGDAQHPYGFVYFSDGNRLLFGDTARGEGPYGLNATNWGRLPKSPYFEIAEKAIKAQLTPKPPLTIEFTEPNSDDNTCSDCLEPMDGHCDECGECECTCDDCPNGCGNAQDDCACECDECGCSTNEFAPGCDCGLNSCPAGCGNGASDDDNEEEI